MAAMMGAPAIIHNSSYTILGSRLINRSSSSSSHNHSALIPLFQSNPHLISYRSHNSSWSPIRSNNFSPNFDFIISMSPSRRAIPPPQINRKPLFSASSARNTSQVSEISSSNQNSRSSNHPHDDHDQQLLQHLSHSMILTIIAFIWRLPGIISGFLNREQTLLDKVEGEVDEAADVIKVGAKVVEGLAEGIEKVAEAIGEKDVEKVAETVEEDAKRVEVLMDKVKERTKVAHDELEEVVESLGKSMQGAEKAIAKVHIKGQSKDSKNNTTGSTIVATPPISTGSTIVTTPPISTVEPSPMINIGTDKHHYPPQGLTIFSPSNWFHPTLIWSLSRFSQLLLAHPKFWIHSFSISCPKLTFVKALVISSFFMSLLAMPKPAILLF